MIVLAIVLIVGLLLSIGVIYASAKVAYRGVSLGGALIQFVVLMILWAIISLLMSALKLVGLLALG